MHYYNMSVVWWLWRKTADTGFTFVKHMARNISKSMPMAKIGPVDLPYAEKLPVSLQSILSGLYPVR